MRSIGGPLIINVVHDPKCPWCHVGKKRLEEAVRETMVDVQIYWRPFFLDEAKPDETKAALEELDRSAPPSVDTMDAHRMLVLAEVLGGAKLQTLLVEEIYNGVELVQAAVKVGINETVAKELFDDKTQLKDEVLWQCEEYSQVDAIPHFTINDEVVHGAQHPDYFVQVLNRAASEVILFRAAYA